MPSEKFIMVSLEDDKSKDLANVISNDTSRRILSFISENESSESDIVRALGLPASTVNYNVQNLLKSNLIEVKDFYWSGKGNKVNVYTIAKKLIVIAPKGTKVSSTLKGLIPVALISVAAAAVINFVYSGFNQVGTFAAKESAPLQAPAAESAIIQDAVNRGGAVVAQSSFLSNYAVWFLIGALFAIIIYLFILLLRRKK
jgi:DNA-binding transcriptional ArsR family regulator